MDILGHTGRAMSGGLDGMWVQRGTVPFLRNALSLILGLLLG